MLEPTTAEELRECIADHPKVVVVGAGTKRRLAGDADGRELISTVRLSGVTEYHPEEYVFTALAGTPLAEIGAMLEENGQYLPFDPPLLAEGATLGGSVAAGLNGPGSLRFGGLRDFVLAVRFVDGAGRLITGGGKVVKNAAGFDFPKLMVGSLGRLGALAEITLKVFPKPGGISYLKIGCSDLAAAVDALNDVSNRPWDLDALDLVPGTNKLKIRMRGAEAALEARRVRIGAEADAGGVSYWAERDSLLLGESGDYLAKVPITPSQIAKVAGVAGKVAISIGGNLAWIACGELRRIEELGLPALVVRGPAGVVQVNAKPHAAIHVAIKNAFDPTGRFPEMVVM